MRGMEMNSPAVARFAPSAQPALELIALAQLSPEQARQKLRALLLANPNYFGKVPSSSFMTVLKIQEDTTFECISRISYDPQRERLCATIDIKQATGYSGDAFIHGSQEFVRFYLSYDGGSKWLDQGMRSLSVFDSHLPRPLVQRVTLEIIPRRTLLGGVCAQDPRHPILEFAATRGRTQLDSHLGQRRRIRFPNRRRRS